MCGRLALDVYIPDLEERFDAKSATHIEWSPKYNVPPKSDLLLPIVITKDHHRVIAPALWGLVPATSSDLSLRLNYETFNAKVETLATSKVYSPSLTLNHFCLVPATGFYEWYKKIKPSQPIFIKHRQEKIFAFAGLWSEWANRNTGETFYTFSIITTSPDSFVEKVHNRMPVILSREAEAAFIDPHVSVEAKVQKFLKTASAQSLEGFPVAREFVSFGKEGPECIKAIDLSLDRLLDAESGGPKII